MRKSFRKLSVIKYETQLQKIETHLSQLTPVLYLLTLVCRHPDKVGKGGEQEYLDIVRAYDVLRDPDARKEYEQLLREGIKTS